eukprot:3957657-Heterocapsa_arctica.AAC.1
MSCPGKSPALESIIQCGYLTQLLSSNIKSGGSDPRVLKRDDLCKEGVPLAAVRNKERKGHVSALL